MGICSFSRGGDRQETKTGEAVVWSLSGVSKVYFPEDSYITVHQLRVCPGPKALPAGFYWYGRKRRSPGRTPNWLQRMLNAAERDGINGSCKRDNQLDSEVGN